ncbi:hypothetical protein Hdeb2414_s0055g00756441 [Helianthus debilis subsp. tardiflorus]
MLRIWFHTYYTNKLKLDYNQAVRFLEGLWQGHGPGKFFGRSANFLHFDQNFLYTLCLARACPVFFSARFFRP